MKPRTYCVGLPVVITVEDGGDVKWVIDKSEASDGIWETPPEGADGKPLYSEEQMRADQAIITANVAADDDDDLGEYMNPGFAQFTELFDGLLAGGPDNPYDVEVGENGNLAMLIIDLNLGVKLGMADYTDEWWSVVLYINHHSNGEEVPFLDVTDRVGHVTCDVPGDQAELARRVRFYLNTEWYQKDLADIKTKVEWDEAFAALRAAGLEADADDPIAARYRAASDAVNHVNRRRETRRLA